MRPRIIHSLCSLVDDSEFERCIRLRVGHQRHDICARRAEIYEGDVCMRQDCEVQVQVCLSNVMRDDQDAAAYDYQYNVLGEELMKGLLYIV